MLTSITSKLSQAIKDDILPVRVHVDNTEHRNHLEWISPTDYPAQQSDTVKRRQKGTGQWFLDAPEVAKWQSEAKATLFCPGIPGAGKTMVAAIAIDSLLESTQDDSAGVAYVYCNYKDQKEQDINRILAAILKQLVQGRPSLAEPLTRLHKQHAHKGTRPSADEISTALQSVIVELSTVYIVIDALDECRNDDGTRRGLLTRIRGLQGKADVRFLATSRFLPDIVDDRVIRLVHYTTQEYLERIRETWNPSAQVDIASTCLTYLSFNDFKNGSCSTDTKLKERLQQSVFLDYAARYWGPHTLPVEDDVYDLACSFLLHKGSVSCTTQVMSISTYKYPGYTEDFPRSRIFTHATAQYGLANILKKLLESAEEELSITVNSKDSYDEDGLYIAA
ncbi:hypothetical protein EJ04DRAFT_497286, partial [Polyplosphaeria fusca]